MTPRERKNRIYKKNGLSEERYRQLVAEDVSSKVAPSEESAILRKAVAYLFEIVAALHPGEINNDEFKKYHESVEAIKARNRAEIEDAR